MGFNEKTRQWWLRVWGSGDANNAQCRKTFYSENRGFYRNCHGENLYVMRIDIEGRGSVGIPICRKHFMVKMGTNFYGWDSSLYPELAWARRDYSKNKKSFKEIDHSSRIRSGDWSTDEYLFNTAVERENNYRITHPEDPKPSSKPIRYRTCADILYEGFYGEDQEKS